jgi:hypothetical protein
MAIKRNLVIEKIRLPYYAIRNNAFIYKNLVNRKHRAAVSDFSNIDLVQKKIIDDLILNGIATASVGELFSNGEFSTLLDWVQKNEVNLKQKRKKKFLYSYYGTEDSSKPIDLEKLLAQGCTV